MNTGKIIADLREKKGWSQTDLADQSTVSMVMIGKYERDEVKPSIDAVKKIAGLLGTTVGYLLSETEQENLLKDPAMLKRLNEIKKMDNEDKSHILHLLDGFIKSVKIKNIAVL